MNSLNDEILSYNFIKFAISQYTGDYSNSLDPFLSPLFMKHIVLEQLPPVRILFGSYDPFRDDIILLIHELM